METYNLFFCNSEFVLLKLKKELDIASGEKDSRCSSSITVT